MSTSGEAAEQVVRISLDGAEEILKITGKGAKELAKLLLSEMKKPQRTKGRASLMALLKQKKPMQVFEIDDRSLRKFCQVAKKYGVLYHVIKNTKNRDGKSDRRRFKASARPDSRLRRERQSRGNVPRAERDRRRNPLLRRG